MTRLVTLINLVVFHLGLSFVSGCVGDGGIDRANATLEQQLAEMRTLNQNVVQASDRIGELGQPISDVANRMGSLVGMLAQNNEKFTAFMETGTRTSNEILAAIQRGTEISNELLAVLHNINPEEIQKFSEALSTGISKFTSLVADGSRDMRILAHSTTNGALLMAKMATRVRILSPEDLATLEGPFESLATSTANVATAGQSQAEIDLAKVTRAIADLDARKLPANNMLTLLERMAEPTERIANNMGDLAEFARDLTIEEAGSPSSQQHIGTAVTDLHTLAQDIHYLRTEWEQAKKDPSTPAWWLKFLPSFGND